MNVLVLGANGYTGSRVVQELIGRGHRVRGLVREMERGASLEARGMEIRVGDIRELESIKTLAWDIDVILNLIGYCREEPGVTRGVLYGGVQNLKQVIEPGALKKYVWASNVAVYGHPKSDVRLTETSALKPDYALGRVTVDVEKLVRNAFPAVTVRVSNIYGPGRDYLDALKTGRIRLLNGGRNWQSRIHVEDLAQVFVAAVERGQAGETYLAGDQLPTTAEQFFGELAEALHVPPPLPLETRASLAFGYATRALNWLADKQLYQLNENVIGLLTGNYFVVNAKLTSELGLTLKYPTFREAYEEMLTGKTSE